MQCCRLRAVDRLGAPHIFTIADVPVRIWEDAFILANVPNSPTLLLDSVVRVMDNMDIGEGDTVLYGDQVCAVSYNRGFIFTTESGIVYPSNQVLSCKVLTIGTRTASVIRFRSPNEAFRMRAIFGMYNGRIITAHDAAPCAVEDIRLSAGFVYQKNRVCYGDTVDGYTLIMWKGRPCIQTEEGYVEIPTHFYLGKE